MRLSLRPAASLKLLRVAAPGPQQLLLTLERHPTFDVPYDVLEQWSKSAPARSRPRGFHRSPEAEAHSLVQGCPLGMRGEPSPLGRRDEAEAALWCLINLTDPTRVSPSRLRSPGASYSLRDAHLRGKMLKVPSWEGRQLFTLHPGAGTAGATSIGWRGWHWVALRFWRSSRAARGP